MYKCILFDMDGTLVNSFEGIRHAYQAAFAAVSKPVPGEAFVRNVIGAPLPQAFAGLAKLTIQETKRAVRAYREYYQSKGKYEVYVYPEVSETLRLLKEKGGFLAVATLKRESFALEMLEHLGLLHCMDAVCGADEDDSFTKADLIYMGMKKAGAGGKETLLVGDTHYDARGARETGVDFLAVTYGFGFRTTREAKEEGARWTARSAAEILPAALKTEPVYTE